jgi:hypothetical protein
MKTTSRVVLYEERNERVIHLPVIIRSRARALLHMVSLLTKSPCSSKTTRDQRGNSFSNAIHRHSSACAPSCSVGAGSPDFALPTAARADERVARWKIRGVASEAATRLGNSFHAADVNIEVCPFDDCRMTRPEHHRSQHSYERATTRSQHTTNGNQGANGHGLATTVEVMMCAASREGQQLLKFARDPKEPRNWTGFISGGPSAQGERQRKHSGKAQTRARHLRRQLNT